MDMEFLRLGENSSAPLRLGDNSSLLLELCRQGTVPAQYSANASAWNLTCEQLLRRRNQQTSKVAKWTARYLFNCARPIISSCKDA